MPTDSPRRRPRYVKPIKTVDYRIHLDGVYWLRDVHLLHAPDGSFRVRIDGIVYDCVEWVNEPLGGPEPGQTHLEVIVLKRLASTPA